MKVANPIHRAMLARIKANDDSWAFSATDFTDLGTRHAVDKALLRMAARGTIRRAVRGIYYVSRQHPIVGTTGPSIDQVAKAVARKSGTRLQHTGAYAANALGLSDQVPAKIVFLTDGRSKRIQLGKATIVFKQVSPRTMGPAGSVTGLVIQALRYFGRTHVTRETIRRLERRLPPEARKRMLKDLVYAPVWIADIIRELAGKH